MKPIRRLYIHFADYYHVRRARLNLTPASDIARSLSAAVRIAVLFAHEVYFPASSLFESPDCRRVMQELPEFREHNVLKIAAADATVTEHLESKAASYGAGSPRELLNAYRQRHKFALPTYVEKKGSSTAEITRVWRGMPDDGDFMRAIREKTGEKLPGDFGKVWERVPQGLQKRAFVPAHAADLLRVGGCAGSLESIIAKPIERAYIDGYGEALNAYVLTDVPYLSSGALEADFRNPNRLSYRDVLQGLSAHRLLDPVLTVESSILFELACSAEWDRFANGLLHSGTGGEMALLSTQIRDVLRARVRETSNGPNDAQMELVMTPVSERTHLPQQNIAANKFDAAILTALPIEFAALQLAIGNGEYVRVEHDPGSYWVGTFTATNGSQKRVLVGLLNRMGNASAATATANLVRSFGLVQHLLFCGIALGVPRPADLDKHVRLGDVVVGDREGVILMSNVTLLAGGEEVSRSNLPPPPATMMRALNELDTGRILGQSPWNEMIEDAIARSTISGGASRFARPGSDTDVVLDAGGAPIGQPHDPNRDPSRPKFFRGVIGSSDKLIRDGEFRDRMANKHSLRAMEMEGAGVLEAAWNFGRSAMVVRGICDYGVGKNDVWHPYAALAAAAMSLSLVSRL